MVSRGLGREPIAPVRVSSDTMDCVMMSPIDAATEVLSVIRKGGLAVVPLDVSYAFLAGAREPLERIYELKLRPASKPCPVLASWSHFTDLTNEGEVAVRRVKRVVDAGLPLGVITTPNWESDVAKSIPRDCIERLAKGNKLALFLNMGGLSEYLIALADRVGTRLFGSSANISGKGNSFSLGDVPPTMLDGVDIVCDAGQCKYTNPERLASTILDLETGELTRRGIVYADIERLLNGSNPKEKQIP